MVLRSAACCGKWSQWMAVSVSASPCQTLRAPARTDSGAHDAAATALRRSHGCTGALRSDAKYQRYAAALERVVAGFDPAAEWPDTIAARGRLAKLLVAHPQYPVVPHAARVARALAECLLAGLPAGVHVKALEIYALIFERISVRARPPARARPIPHVPLTSLDSPACSHASHGPPRRPSARARTAAVRPAEHAGAVRRWPFPALSAR